MKTKNIDSAYILLHLTRIKYAKQIIDIIELHISKLWWTNINYIAKTLSNRIWLNLKMSEDRNVSEIVFLFDIDIEILLAN